MNRFSVLSVFLISIFEVTNASDAMLIRDVDSLNLHSHYRESSDLKGISQRSKI